MKKIIRQNYFLLLIVLICIIGLFLRFYRLPETLNFFYDTARDMDKAREIIVDRKMTLIGHPTSFGQGSNRETYMGPAYYYFLAISEFVFHFNPIFVVALIGVMNVFSAVLFLSIINDFIANKLMKLVLFSLYLFSPLLIYYSRLIWNPCLLPFFAMLAIFCFWKFLKNKKLLYLFFSGVVSGISFQIHYVTIPLFLSAFVILIYRNQKTSERITYQIKTAVMLLISFLIGISPIIIFDIRHNFYNSESLMINLSHGEGTDLVQLASYYFQYFYAMSNRLFGTISYSVHSMDNRILPINIVFSICAVVLICFGLIKKSKNEKEVSIFKLYCLVQLLCGLFFAAFSSQKVQMNIEDRYFIVLIPSFLLLISFGLRDLRRNKAIFIIYLLIAFFSLKQDWKYLRENVGIDNYNVNYRAAKEIADIISEDVKSNNINGQFNIANTIDSNSRAVYYRYLLHVNKVFPLSVEQYPQAQYLYVVTRDSAKKVVDSTRWEISSLGQKKVIDVFDAPFNIKIIKLQKINENK